MENDALEEIMNTLSNLESKVEKRKIELERNERRLLTLKNVKPAYIDEYETLNKEFQSL